MIDLPSPSLIGVIHLKALPGCAGNILTVEEICRLAMADGKVLAAAGFDAAVVENFGDAPFAKQRVDPATIAAMTLIAAEVRRACHLRIGINVLRNDAKSALGIAAAVGASFIRVNVHSGVYATDQGIIEGRADETTRFRRLLGAKVAILADVHVKHATPLHHCDIARAAKDTAYRGLADGLIVTGPATGEAVNLDDLRQVREAVPDRWVFVGSGARIDTVGELLTLSNGVIVGSGLKADSDPANPVDPGLAMSFAFAAGRR